MSIQVRLSKLKPYVSGIRFHEDLPVVDTLLTNGWGIKKHANIEINKGKKQDDDKVHIMFYGITPDISIDSILDHVESVIERNLEREKKYELLKVKAKELQDFFEKHSYEELLTIKFQVDKPSLLSSPHSDINIEDADEEDEGIEEPLIEEKPKVKKATI